MATDHDPTVVLRSGATSIPDSSCGVDLKKEIGIKLSAQSGYNQNVAVKLTMGTGGGHFCGSNDLPPKAQWVVTDQTQFGNPGQ